MRIISFKIIGQLSTFPLNYSKLHMNNTLYVQESTAFLNIHQGLYIDIFPVDKIYRGPLLRLQIALIGSSYKCKMCQTK